MLNQEEKLKLVYKIANNALFFDDSSDYKSALWEILFTITPELDDFEELKYID